MKFDDSSLVDLEWLEDGKWVRIAEKIRAIWGTKECHAYIDSVIFDLRGNRKGFPKSTMDVLIRIHKEHLRFYQPPGDVWSDSILTE